MRWSIHGHMSAARGGERLHAFRAELAASLGRNWWWRRACVASARCDKQAFRTERQLMDRICKLFGWPLGFRGKSTVPGSAGVPQTEQLKFPDRFMSEPPRVGKARSQSPTLGRSATNRRL